MGDTVDGVCGGGGVLVTLVTPSVSARGNTIFSRAVD